jgi:RNA polymerase sigma-70 factor (sigma-E family)
MDLMDGPAGDRTDDEDFVAFVNARWAPLYRFAWLLTGGHESAEDLLQLALEKAFVRWGRIRRMDAPEAYVRRVVANTAISQSRRSFVHHEVNQAELPEYVSASFEDGSDSRSVLWPLVCGLPPRQRAVVVLRFYEDLTEAQVAQELGCSIGTVKSQGHDAMQSLRRGVDAWTTGEVTA